MTNKEKLQQKIKEWTKEKEKMIEKRNKIKQELVAPLSRKINNIGKNIVEYKKRINDKK